MNNNADILPEFSMPLVFMFSGQGSHHFHMAQNLYQEHEGFRKHLQNLDILALKYLNCSIIEKIYDSNLKKDIPFTDIHFSHPALFSIQCALAKSIMDCGITPDMVLGYSIGEFVASVIAGVLTVESGFFLVCKQAELIERYCPQGAMTAILETPDLYYTLPIFQEKVDLAGINYSRHFVVSGGIRPIEHIGAFCLQNQIDFQDLPVTFAFHSDMMDPAYDEFIRFSSAINFAGPKIRMISGLDGLVTSLVNAYYLWNATRKAVFFNHVIRRLEQQGPNLYLDLGPSGTLATFIKYNLDKCSQSRYCSLINEFSLGMDICTINQRQLKTANFC
ncbi:MAG: acyltransferase domain-containing protein [Chitinivibrionales bacterium]|nr:acyltransferase domain-containing protein [Chitinivibrionales bacterium]